MSEMEKGLQLMVASTFKKKQIKPIVKKKKKNTQDTRSEEEINEMKNGKYNIKWISRKVKLNPWGDKYNW